MLNEGPNNMVGKKGVIGIGKANDDKLGTIRKVLPNPPTHVVSNKFKQI